MQGEHAASGGEGWKKENRQMANITKDEVLEWVKNAPALELAELVNEMEEVFGVSAAAPVAVAAAAGAGGDALQPRRRRRFDVVLTGAGDKKIQVIKAVRELTDPRSQGGQGRRRQPAEARSRGCRQGEGRRSQGQDRRGRRNSRAPVGRFSLLRCSDVSATIVGIDRWPVPVGSRPSVTPASGKSSIDLAGSNWVS